MGHFNRGKHCAIGQSDNESAQIVVLDLFDGCARSTCCSRIAFVALVSLFAFFTIRHGKRGGSTICKGDGVGLFQAIGRGQSNICDAVARVTFITLVTRVTFVAIDNRKSRGSAICKGDRVGIR